MNNAIVLESQNLSKSVQLGDTRLPLLDKVNLQVNQGSSMAIVGQSGSGKSTLLGLLAGLDVPSSGSIKLLGHPLETLSEDERAQLRARQVGFVFQNFQLLPHLTALENVMLPLEIAALDSPTPKARELLTQVGLEHRLNHYPNQLSGGEQQRVAVARAFACEPKILFADEPTGNLDTQTGHLVADLLFAMNAERDTTLVLVTHDLQLAQRCATQITLDSGKIL